MTKHKKDLIRSLNPDDALHVLKTLVSVYPDLEDKVYYIIQEFLSDVNSDDVMTDVFHALDILDVDDLYNRSGRSRDGYTDPGDEAWVMFEEALEPFISDMQKYQDLRMLDLAKEYCVGIIKGIREYEKDSSSEFTDWVIDAPEESIANVFEEWKKGQPSEDDIVEVLRIIKNEDK